MRTNDYIAKWILNIPGEKIDQLSEEFGTDFSNEDVEDAVSSAEVKNPKTIGNSVWLMFMDKLKDRFSDLFPDFDKDKLEWDSPDGGTDYMDIYYDGEEFSNLMDLESLLNKQHKY